jgi:hypothetical protein
MSERKKERERKRERAKERKRNNSNFPNVMCPSSKVFFFFLNHRPQVPTD